MCMHYDAGNWNYPWGVSDADMYDDVDYGNEEYEPEDSYDSILREEEREMAE